MVGHLLPVHDCLLAVVQTYVHVHVHVHVHVCAMPLCTSEQKRLRSELDASISVGFFVDSIDIYLYPWTGCPWPCRS